MIKKILWLIALSLPLYANAQIEYEKGYYINNSGEKTNCLIKNLDWKDNPTEFKYKLFEEDEARDNTIKSVKEFGIDGGIKYQRFEVKIDRSSELVKDLSRERNPIFNTELLFLEPLVRGKASLYYYEKGNLRRYFISINNSAPEQLVYKSYLAKNRFKSDEVKKNKMYKQQLYKYLSCKDISLNQVKSIGYYTKDLVKLFKAYNDCKGNEIDETSEASKLEKDYKLFHISLKPGISSSSLGVYPSNGNDRKSVSFDKQLRLRFGVEFEFVMPFNKGKWALFTEPAYQSFKGEEIINFNSFNPSVEVAIDYSSVELPLGIRYYMYLNSRTKMFINAAYVIDIHGPTELKYEGISNLEVNTAPNLSLGVGYKFRNTFSVELRRGFTREMFRYNSYWKGNYNTISFIFGYTII